MNSSLFLMNAARNVASERSAGVLLHPTSLPGGRLGSEAFRFVDWLAEAGQRWWQVLPLGPPDRFGSPYAGLSAFAGSPALLARPTARVSVGELEDFVAAQHYWVGGWTSAAARGALADQVRFDREWSGLHRYAAERGIRILGDIPFYVARAGADQIDRPRLFDDTQATGVPPDDWSATGQLWNSPIYDWESMRADRYQWWSERFRRMFEIVDAVRIDHFRGFVAFWSVPRGNRTAQFGRWRRGPGIDLFRAVRETLGPVDLVAENLGVITPAVERLRARLGIPGTVVLQFSFSESLINRPPRGNSANDVVYSGTHDNDTALGWWRSASAHERANVERALTRLGITDPEPQWKLVRLALHHGANLCVVPAQDLLGLGSAARMNHPGRRRGNWRWRLEPGALTRLLASRLREETLASGRLG